jgi:hypothetical protein
MSVEKYFKSAICGYFTNPIRRNFLFDFFYCFLTKTFLIDYKCLIMR